MSRKQFHNSFEPFSFSFVSLCGRFKLTYVLISFDKRIQNDVQEHVMRKSKKNLKCHLNLSDVHATFFLAQPPRANMLKKHDK